MMTAADLRSAFSMYLAEIQKCETLNCWWALAHILVALPDICAALDGKPQGAQRYVDWCAENFAADPKMLPGDRYQMRCALLHEGTTIPEQGRKHATQYSAFSFIDPVTTGTMVHQLVEPDMTRGGDMFTVNIKGLADDTRAALENWFARLATDAARNAIVAGNLNKLAAVKPKILAVPSTVPGQNSNIILTSTTSST